MIPLSESALTLCILCIVLVPLTIAGLALINAGLGRSHSAAHVMLASLCVFAVSASVYMICGFAWQGYGGGAGHSITIGGKPWNLLGGEGFLMHGLKFDGTAPALTAWLQMFSVGLAAVIPLGAGLDRWKLSASCASAALLAGWTYPLFAHWVWGGGWLAQLGSNYGVGRGFVDAGGTSTIQIVGGLTALAMAWILGPRSGKYNHEGMPSAIPGHNGVFILAGCFLASVGWLGLNCAGAILFAGAEPRQVPLIGVNTILAAGGAALVAALLTHYRFGRPDLSICANGWIGGLAAGSAGCVFVSPAEMLLIGIVAGVLVTYSVDWFELNCRVDDPGGTVSAHAVAGFWGLLAVAIFGQFADAGANATAGAGAAAASGQWLAQVAGIATLLGFVLPLTYGLNFALNRILPQRVVREGERQGLDLYELGAGAYPEFVIHSDEFTQLH